MRYIIICQHNDVSATCFSSKALEVTDGHIRMGEIDTTGTVPYLTSGTISNGKLYNDDDMETTIPE